MYRLYLGLSCSDGKLISDADFNSWVKDTFAHFVPGFTVLSGTGYWNGSSEPSRIIEVLDLEKSKTLQQTLYTLAQSYAEHFHQDCVLVVKTDVQSSVLVEPVRRAA